MLDKLTMKVNRRYLIISLSVVLVLGIFMMGFYARWFSTMANGYPYMETKFFYAPQDLLDMAAGYGSHGRDLYIKTSLSLDMIIPLAAANFLTAFALYLTKKFKRGDRWRKAIFTSGIAVCLTDWFENFCMMGILMSFPAQPYWMAVAGRVLTSVKYAMALAFVIMLILELYQIKRQNQAVNIANSR